MKVKRRAWEPESEGGKEGMEGGVTAGKRGEGGKKNQPQETIDRISNTEKLQ